MGTWKMRRVTEEERQQMIEQYQGGTRVSMIAAGLGRPSLTVYQVLDKAGVRPYKTPHVGNIGEAEREDIVRRYLAGATYPAIAKAIGRSRSSVLRAIHAAGVRPAGFERQRLTARALNDEQEQEVVALAQTDMPRRDLAKQFNITQITLNNILRRHGAYQHGHYAVRIQQDPAITAEIVTRWQGGETQRGLAKAYGVSVDTIINILLAAGQVLGKKPQLKGSAHHSWKGRSLRNDGYMLVRVDDDDPLVCMRRTTDGYILEHRLVMARKLGRPLADSETVHHIDGDKSNNDPANLQLRQGRHGTGVILQCLDCGSSNVGHAPIADSMVGA